MNPNTPIQLIREAPVTVAHDYFTQFGGAERVAVALISGLKPQNIVTSVQRADHTFPMPRSIPVRTTFLQYVAAFRRDPRRALPLLALAWSSLKPIDSGVVVCSSSGWAHGVPIKPGVVKVVYCHNPARWLYQPDDYFRDRSSALRALFRVIREPLRRWDRAAARSADAYIANSTSVAARISEIYGIDPHLIHPPVAIDVSAAKEGVDGIGESPFFLSVGRGRGYKNLDLLVEAFRRTPDARLVMVGAQVADPPRNVVVLPRVSDAQMRWLYARARALISMSHEDFGLTPIEANAFGTPVLVLRGGGFLDSVIEGVTGEFVDEESAEAVSNAVERFPIHWDERPIRAHAATFGPDAFIEKVQNVVDGALSARARQQLAWPRRIAGRKAA